MLKIFPVLFVRGVFMGYEQEINPLLRNSKRHRKRYIPKPSDQVRDCLEWTSTLKDDPSFPRFPATYRAPLAYIDMNVSENRK